MILCEIPPTVLKHGDYGTLYSQTKYELNRSICCKCKN